MMAEVKAKKRQVLSFSSVDTPLPTAPVVHIWTSENADDFEFEDGLPHLPKGTPKSA